MKNKDIEKYSNPSLVLKKAKMIFGNDIQLKLSTRKDKKYMLFNPNNNKWIHFGYYGMEDYTKHKNLQRREQFRTRNKKWSKQEPYTAGFLSYFLLW